MATLVRNPLGPRPFLPGRRLLVLAAIFLVAANLPQAADRACADESANERPRPNIVLINADDK